MTRCRRLTAGAALAACAAGIWSCSETTKPPPQVTSVVVTSPIGPRLAVGRSVQLVAVAKDASGAVVPGVVLTWSSSATGVADVTGAGLVTGRGEGPVTITAQVAGVGGDQKELVLAADLPGAKALLADPFAGALLGHLTSTFLASQLQLAVGQCNAGIDAGDFDTMEAAVDSARSAMAAASDPTDKALTATYALFVDQAYRLLKL